MEKKQKIGIVAVLVGGLLLNIFLAIHSHKIHSHKKEIEILRAELATTTAVLNIQANELATQAAAWGVLLSPYTADQRAGFVEAVNQALQAK